MRKTFLLPILLVSLAACGERKEPAKTPAPSPADTVAAAPELAPPPPRDTGFNPANVVNFEQTIYMEYAHVGTEVPRQTLDSILHATKDPVKLEDEMNKYMHHHDTLARIALADKYGITIDSLNRIITRRSARK